MSDPGTGESGAPPARLPAPAEPLCQFCRQPCDELQPLIELKDGSFEHPVCSNQHFHEQQEQEAALNFSGSSSSTHPYLNQASPLPLEGPVCQHCQTELDELEAEYAVCLNCLLEGHSFPRAAGSPNFRLDHSEGPHKEEEAGL